MRKQYQYFICGMARTPHTPEQLAEGRKLAASLRLARQRQNEAQAQLATHSGISIDTIRKLEQDGITAPSFVTVARLARQLQLPLDVLASEVLAAKAPSRARAG
jgi:transcriptional regulator with XRE-family HTH domain